MISSIPKLRSFLSTHLLPPPLSLPKPSLLPVPTRSSPQTLLYVRPKPRKSVAFAGLGGGGQDCAGSIHVITGPMFAGKTTALLRRVEDERSKGSNVMMIKSKKDNRYALDYVVTHDGAKMPCWALSELSTFREVVGAEAYEKLDVIGIDEAQFFGDLHDFCRHAADYDGKSIIVAGLDGDYLRRSFGSVIDIIPLADSVTKLTAWCEVCGNHALFTLRKTEQTKTELIGGADVYMPVCRQHYISGQVVINAARNVLDQKTQAESQTEVVSLQ